MTHEEQECFDRWADDRAKKPLPTGWRWLTPDDTWIEGDEYDGLLREPQSWNIQNRTPRWWKIGSRFTDLRVGDKVPLSHLCYTPRGKR